MKKTDLKGKAFAVTGSSRGLGFFTALKLVERELGCGLRTWAHAARLASAKPNVSSSRERARGYARLRARRPID